MKTLVDRSGLKIKSRPQKQFEVGAIFQYSGSSTILKGFLLVHKLNPKLEMLSKSQGKDVYADEHVVAEVLRPELGYADDCLFWIEKKYLRCPSQEEFTSIYQRLKATEEN